MARAKKELTETETVTTETITTVVSDGVEYQRVDLPDGDTTYFKAEQETVDNIMKKTDKVILKVMVDEKYKNSKQVLPQRVNADAACFDLFAQQGAIIKPKQPHTFELGFRLEVPKGYAFQIYPKSGIACVNGVTLANCVGIIDSDYRGIVKATLWNTSNYDMMVRKYEPICQGKLVELIPTELQTVEEISETERGDAGYGELDKKVYGV